MTSVKEWSSRAWVIAGILVTVILAGVSLVLVGALGGGLIRGGSPFAACAVPNLSGPVVNVTLTNMGGPMMGGGNGPMSGGAMRLNSDRAAVRSGTVSFLVTNGGSVAHEMVVLPLSGSQIVGTRSIGGDAKIDEAGSLGEASNTCAEGPGQGILPGTSSWMRVQLKPGRYELVCNFPGHYAAGMYTQLTVTE